MGNVRGIRLRLARLLHGDPTDAAPGWEQAHLRGRALRRAVDRGEVDLRGATRTRRLEPPEAPER